MTEQEWRHRGEEDAKAWKAYSEGYRHEDRGLMIVAVLAIVGGLIFGALLSAWWLS